MCPTSLDGGRAANKKSGSCCFAVHRTTTIRSGMLEYSSRRVDKNKQQILMAHGGVILGASQALGAPKVELQAALSPYTEEEKIQTTRKTETKQRYDKNTLRSTTQCRRWRGTGITTQTHVNILQHLVIATYYKHTGLLLRHPCFLEFCTAAIFSLLPLNRTPRLPPSPPPAKINGKNARAVSKKGRHTAWYNSSSCLPW